MGIELMEYPVRLALRVAATSNAALAANLRQLAGILERDANCTSQLTGQVVGEVAHINDAPNASAHTSDSARAFGQAPTLVQESLRRAGFR